MNSTQLCNNMKLLQWKMTASCYAAENGHAAVVETVTLIRMHAQQKGIKVGEAEN